MKTLSTLWTAAVAYISLLVGAGLSMAGNLADTYRTRGHDVDGLDKILAISWPALVILAIEMFVSPRWPRKALFQVWRWIGCLAIGGMAMLASWTHLHDLLASRGQLATVSLLGPLAIDGMAIMATGLILASRGQPVASDETPGQTAGQAVASPGQTAGQAVASPGQWASVAIDRYLPGHDRGVFAEPLATQPDDPTIDATAELARWEAGYQEAMTELGQQVASEAEQFLAGEASGQSSSAPAIEKIPDEARELILAMKKVRARAGEIDQAVAEMCEVSLRTARRWRASVQTA